MRTLRQPLFISCVFLFCLNQVLEQTNNSLEPLRSYLDDLLALPIVLTLILAAERTYFNNPTFVLPPAYTVAAVLVFSIFFEGIFPLISARHTADVWDVAFYAVGAAVFHIILNRPLR